VAVATHSFTFRASEGKRFVKTMPRFKHFNLMQYDRFYARQTEPHEGKTQNHCKYNIKLIIFQAIYAISYQLTIFLQISRRKIIKTPCRFAFAPWHGA
jgi:hypothetical protein